MIRAGLEQVINLDLHTLWCRGAVRLDYLAEAGKAFGGERLAWDSGVRGKAAESFGKGDSGVGTRELRLRNMTYLARVFWDGYPRHGTSKQCAEELELLRVGNRALQVGEAE
jgi:hypothetical protein